MMVLYLRMMQRLVNKFGRINFQMFSLVYVVNLHLFV